MNSIFDKSFYLTQNHEECIALFDKIEEFEIFQMRMGLENLCQNTLIYPVGKYSDGSFHYELHSSPHSKNFYNVKCQKFCKVPENSTQCNKMMHKIAICLFESHDIKNLEMFDIDICFYDDETPSRIKYILYQCPFVHLYKCAFPIYVEDTIVAVLFTGQFPIDISTIKIPFIRLQLSSPDGTPSVVFNRRFDNKDTLKTFINNNLIPVVLSFSQKAEEKLLEQQEKILYEKIEKQIFSLETEITKFLVAMENTFVLEDPGNITHQRFWDIISKNLASYLELVEVDSFFVFIDEANTLVKNSKVIYGTQIYPTIIHNNNVTFNSCCIFEDMNETTLYTRNEQGHHINKILFEYLTGETFGSYEKCDVISHNDQICPFSIAINYKSSARILNKGLLQRKVLEHLKSFFIVVSQELIHLSTLRSEQINKSVLRIYRHEIIHQLQVLKHNNLFLDAKKLRETDENKLSHVAEDQLQCIQELTFITQNINVFTGKVSKQSSNIEKNQLIDVNSSIINKAISLYQRAKRDKCLWFLIQNSSNNNVIKTNQMLLDMIFFNLMSNAIKYSYSGTNIIIGFTDTFNYSRPHIISITDFGSPVNADYHNQIFEMYFRGSDTSEQVEGSGIGLYVANEVAGILDAKLSWKSTKISDYNVPLLMRYLQFPTKLLNLPPDMLFSAYKEHQKLQNNMLLNQIFNDEYLNNPSEWNELEIEEELQTPTYKVTFEIEL